MFSLLLQSNPASRVRAQKLEPQTQPPVTKAKAFQPMRLLIYSVLFIALIALPQACGKTEHLQGQNLYLQHCASCHFETGEGLRLLMPPLAGSDYLKNYPAEVVRGIRKGMSGKMVVNGKTYDHEMPGNKELSEFQIVNIVNYINQAWGNDYGNITVEDSRKWLEE